MATNTNEAPNLLLTTTTTAYVVFYIRNVTKKIDFLFRVEVIWNKKSLCITFISIVGVFVIAVVAIPVIVVTKKSDTKAASTTTAKITTTTTIETSTKGSFMR
jgi:hypothetical protein